MYIYRTNNTANIYEEKDRIIFTLLHYCAGDVASCKVGIFPIDWRTLLTLKEISNVLITVIRTIDLRLIFKLCELYFVLSTDSDHEEIIVSLIGTSFREKIFNLYPDLGLGNLSLEEKIPFFCFFLSFFCHLLTL